MAQTRRQPITNPIKKQTNPPSYNTPTNNNKYIPTDNKDYEMVLCDDYIPLFPKMSELVPEIPSQDHHNILYSSSISHTISHTITSTIANTISITTKQHINKSIRNPPQITKKYSS
ncbi:hypothetical protein ACTFIW_000009 [Dictyostelium discoideum]